MVINNLYWLIGPLTIEWKREAPVGFQNLLLLTWTSSDLSLHDFGAISLLIGDVVDFVDGAVVVDELIWAFHFKPTDVAEAAGLFTLRAVGCFDPGGEIDEKLWLKKVCFQ